MIVQKSWILGGDIGLFGATCSLELIKLLLLLLLLVLIVILLACEGDFEYAVRKSKLTFYVFENPA